MNNTIWKYILNAGQVNNIDIPLGAEVLSVETQGDDIVLYALVNSVEKSKQQIEVRAYGTGHDIDVNLSDYNFLGTAKLHNGSLMFHVFYKSNI